MKELKEICHKILTETKPNARKSHPLYNGNIDIIVEAYDRIFSNQTDISTPKNIRSL